MADPSSRGASAGDVSAALGIVALVCAAIPMIGDLIALLPAAAAIAFGAAGLIAHEKGRTTRVATAVVGTLLGALVILMIAVFFAASQMPA